MSAPATSVVYPELVPGAAPAPAPSPRTFGPAAKPSPGLQTAPAGLPVASPAASPAVAPRADFAVTANKGDHTLSVVDVDAGQLAATIPLDRVPHTIALTPDDRLALVTDNSPGSRVVLVVDVSARRKVGEVVVGSQPDGIAIDSRTGQAVVANSADNSISVFDLTHVEAGPVQAAATIEVGKKPHGVGIANVDDASKAFVANEEDGTVSVVDLDNRQIVETIQIGGKPTAVAVSPDGTQVFVLKHDPDRLDNVVVLDASANQQVAEIEVARDLTDLASSLDGRSVFVGASEPNRNLYKIDLSVRRVTEHFNVAGSAGVRSVATGRAPDRVVMTTDAGQLAVFDAATRQAALIISVGRDPSDVAVSGHPAPPLTPAP